MLEGASEPVCVGSFEMSLAFPATESEALGELDRRLRARLNARPAPPARFRRAGFVGRWRLLLEFEDSPPAFFELHLDGDSSFHTEGSPQLAGTWGTPTWLDGATHPAGHGATHPEAAGTHLWLKVERDKSTESLRGIGGLPVRDSFSMYGRPALGAPEAELAARTREGGASDSVRGGIFWPGNSRDSTLAGSFCVSRCDDEDEGAPPPARFGA